MRARRRGCGKCGKAERFLRGFSKRLWESVLFTDFHQTWHFPQPLARVVFGPVAKDTDIRNGKNPSKVRTRIQTPNGRTGRDRASNDGPGRTRVSNLAKPDRTVAKTVSQQRQRSGRPAVPTGAPIGSREREAEGEDRRPGHANRTPKKTASLGSTAEKRQYVRDHLEQLGSVSKACQVTGLAPSSYYYKPDRSDRQRREAEDEKLRLQIDDIHAEFPGYGYRRIVRELDRRGIQVNAKRVRRVMGKYDLGPIVWRAFIRTTDSKHQLPIYPNLIKNRKVRALNEVWVADITYIRIRSSFVYLAAILYSRRIVGWAISKRIDSALCVAALRMALDSRRPGPDCIHHSDRGSQYASADYVDLLGEHGVQISMSAKGNPYDNAFIESFYKTLKYEEVHLWNYETYDDVIERLPFFIEEVYNFKRLHSSIGYVPPNEFEDALVNMKPADRPVLILGK